MLTELRWQTKDDCVCKDGLRKRVDTAMQNPRASNFKTLSAIFLVEKGIFTNAVKTSHTRSQRLKTSSNFKSSKPAKQIFKLLVVFKLRM